MADPSYDHWLGIKRLLRYIKGTLIYGLKFVAHENDDDLYGFADVNWAGDVVHVDQSAVMFSWLQME